jgi:hypothetical protein
MLVETYKDPSINMRAKIADKVAAQGNGEWCSTEGFDKFTIHVVKNGNPTFSAQMYVSNEDAPPAAGGVAYGTAPVTDAALIEIKVPVRWMRLNVGSISGGSISAYLEAV